MKLLTDSIQKLSKDIPKFKTCAWYHKEMDEITFLTKDCSYVTENDSNSAIQLLKHKGEIVGFHIENPKEWMKQCKKGLK